MSCSMPGCSHHKRFKPEGISFHVFPRREILRTWLKAVRKDVKTWKWSGNKFVCSAHFNDEDYTIKNNIKYLKKSAVPRNTNVEQEQSITASTHSSSATVEKPIIFKRKYSIINNPLYKTFSKEKAANISVCQLHFKPEDVIHDLNQISLNYDAVPVPNREDFDENNLDKPSTSKLVDFGVANLDESYTSKVTGGGNLVEPSTIAIVNLSALFGISDVPSTSHRASASKYKQIQT